MSDIHKKFDELRHIAYQIYRCQMVLECDAETVRICAHNNMHDACDDVPLSAIARDLDAFRRRQIRRLRAELEAVPERCKHMFGAAWEEAADE